MRTATQVPLRSESSVLRSAPEMRRPEPLPPIGSKGENMRATQPSVDYLANCSKSTLESLELSRLNAAANLRKQFHQMLSELIEHEVDARLARAILDWHRGEKFAARSREIPALPSREEIAASSLPLPEQLSIAFETMETTRQSCEEQEVDRIATGFEGETMAMRRRQANQTQQPQPNRKPLSLPTAAASVASVESLKVARRIRRHIRPKRTERTKASGIPHSSRGIDKSLYARFALRSDRYRVRKQCAAPIRVAPRHFGGEIFHANHPVESTCA